MRHLRVERSASGTNGEVSSMKTLSKWKKTLLNRDLLVELTYLSVQQIVVQTSKFKRRNLLRKIIWHKAKKPITKRIM